MDEQTKNDVGFVLTVLQQMPAASIRGAVEDGGNTEAELDEAMKRLGEIVGMDAGIL